MSNAAEQMPTTTAEFTEAVTTALAPKRRAPRKPKAEVAKAEAPATAKAEAPAKGNVPVDQLAAKNEQKRIDGLRAKLRKNAERKVELAREERELIQELRDSEVPWRLLADDVRMSHVGLQRRYRDIIDAAKAKAASLTGK